MLNKILIIFFVFGINCMILKTNQFDGIKYINLNIKIESLDFKKLDEALLVFGINEAERENFKKRIKEKIISYFEEFSIKERSKSSDKLDIYILAKKAENKVCEKDFIIYIETRLNNYNITNNLFLSNKNELELDILKDIRNSYDPLLKNRRKIKPNYQKWRKECNKKFKRLKNSISFSMLMQYDNFIMEKENIIKIVLKNFGMKEIKEYLSNDIEVFIFGKTNNFSLKLTPSYLPPISDFQEIKLKPNEEIILEKKVFIPKVFTGKYEIKIKMKFFCYIEGYYVNESEFLNTKEINIIEKK